MADLENRYDFVYYFDVTNGNPNGDPDAGNLPRIDAETSKGITTDVCLKRKVRNYVLLAKEECEGYKIYVKEKAVHNRQHAEAGAKEEKNKDSKATDSARSYMMKNYFDVRTFGAVMSTGFNAGQVRGPVQFTFSQSIDSIVQSEVTITRMSVTNEKDVDKERTMGRKAFVPYGLYRMEGYVSASIAQQTGFSNEDLDLLWEALINMWEHDHSAARGKMNARKLIVFKHTSKLGNAPSQTLFDLVTCSKVNSDDIVRQFSDYNITLNKSNLPNGVEMIEKL